MIGLPFEDDSDIEAIIQLVENIVKRVRKRLNINITISPFIPKPLTPFQWCRMRDRDELLLKQYILKKH